MILYNSNLRKRSSFVFFLIQSCVGYSLYRCDKNTRKNKLEGGEICLGSCLSGFNPWLVGLLCWGPMSWWWCLGSSSWQWCCWKTLVDRKQKVRMQLKTRTKHILQSTAIMTDFQLGPSSQSFQHFSKQKATDGNQVFNMCPWGTLHVGNHSRGVKKENNTWSSPLSLEKTNLGQL